MRQEGSLLPFSCLPNSNSSANRFSGSSTEGPDLVDDDSISISVAILVSSYFKLIFPLKLAIVSQQQLQQKHEELENFQLQAMEQEELQTATAQKLEALLALFPAQA